MSGRDRIAGDGCPVEAHKLGRCFVREAARDVKVAQVLDPVDAILAVECPDCGMEKWPCFAVGDSKMVHLDRIRASRTTTKGPA